MQSLSSSHRQIAQAFVGACPGRSRAALALAGVLIAMPLHAVEGPMPAPVEIQADSRAIISVRLQRVDRLLLAEGLVESSHQATVAAQVNGLVVQTLVDAGQAVRKGQLLALIDPREVAAGRDVAQAQVGMAESRAREARQAWERTRSLRERNFVSEAALDQAKAALDTAEAGLRAARAGEALAGVQQQHARVLAPQDGIVAARLAEVGELATPGRPLFIVHQPGDLRVVVSLPASMPLDARAPTIRVTAVDIPALDHSVQPGTVTLLPAVDVRDQSRRLRIDLGAEPGLVPGMAAKVSLTRETVERLAVPVSAITWRGELATVRVVAADGQQLLRQVRLGDTFAGGWIEVLSGLAAGERLLLADANIRKTR
jgi:RND family efflux transporter MFP subunit